MHLGMEHSMTNYYYDFSWKHFMSNYLIFWLKSRFRIGIASKVYTTLHDTDTQEVEW